MPILCVTVCFVVLWLKHMIFGIQIMFQFPRKQKCFPETSGKEWHSVPWHVQTIPTHPHPHTQNRKHSHISHSYILTFHYAVINWSDYIFYQSKWNEMRTSFMVIITYLENSKFSSFNHCPVNAQYKQQYIFCPLVNSHFLQS